MQVDNWVYDEANSTFIEDPDMAKRLMDANPNSFRKLVATFLEANGRGESVVLSKLGSADLIKQLTYRDKVQCPRLKSPGLHSSPAEQGLSAMSWEVRSFLV